MHYSFHDTFQDRQRLRRDQFPTGKSSNCRQRRRILLGVNWRSFEQGKKDVGGGRGRGRGNDDDDDEDDDFSEEEMEAVMRKVFHYPEHWGVKGVRRIDEDRYLPSSWHDLVEEMHRVLID